jgi:hypothetical protein
MNRIPTTICLTLLIALGAAISHTSSAQTITGAAQLTLTAPASEEQKAAAEQAAADSLRSALFQWVDESLGRTPNISNAVEKNLFNAFSKTCLAKARRESSVEDKDLRVSYTLTAEQAQAAVQEHNGRYDADALRNWREVNDALKKKQYSAAFCADIQAVYAAMAHLGEPLKCPEDPTSFLFVAAQKKLADQIKRLKIDVSEPVIKGTPSALIQNQVVITAMIDSLPMAGLPLICQLPSGRELMTVTTDPSGNAALTRMKMPFVAHGTFLNIRPNFGAIVDPSLTIPASEFGITLQDGQDQTLIFNLVRPVYTLDYEVSAVNKVTIPKDFQESTRFNQFLKDSLHMQPANGTAADLAIKIRCQVTSYTSDETEQTKLKTEVQASVRQLGPNGTAVEQTVVLNEKEYAHSNQVQATVFKKKNTGEEPQKIPLGDYFWETNSALHALLRDMLNKL